ncbi:hypothetical protein [Lysobacter gummosus]
MGPGIGNREWGIENGESVKTKREDLIRNRSRKCFGGARRP